MSDNSQLDLSGYKQAKSAAKATRKKLAEIAKSIGQDPEIEMTLREEDGSYVLYWEGGPYNWAFDVGGTDNSLVGMKFTGSLDNDDMWIEPKTSYALTFGNY